MRYTTLVHWQAAPQGATGGTATRRMAHLAAPTDARPQSPSGAPGPQAVRGVAPISGGAVGGYAAMLAVMARQETTRVAALAGQPLALPGAA